MGTFRYITHPFATRHQGCPHAAVRLACVRHAASVQSEPGSNSSVQSLFRLQYISVSICPQNTDKVLLSKSLLSLANVCFFFLLTNVHTYHLFFFKDHFVFTSSPLPIKRFVYHQQRNEIMNLFLFVVKTFLFYFLKNLPNFSSLSPLTPFSAAEKRNYATHSHHCQYPYPHILSPPVAFSHTSTLLTKLLLPTYIHHTPVNTLPPALMTTLQTLYRITPSIYMKYIFAFI